MRKAFKTELKKLSVAEITAYANEIRKEIKNKACYCTHSCFQFVNILFNPKLLHTDFICNLVLYCTY